MTDLNESSTINSTNVPYLGDDRSELSPLYSNAQDSRGLRNIISVFSLFSIIITIILAIHLQYGNHQVVPHGSVVTDSSYCTIIGSDIIKSGGNAVDAAVASAFCMGVVHPHLTGLGSGGLMIIYDQRLRRARDCIDFRVVKSQSKSVGVPGFIAGLYSAHSNHGILPWKEVIMPSILVSRTGFEVSENLFSSKHLLKINSSALYTWLMPLLENQIVKNPNLADLLEDIAKFGPDAFYKNNKTWSMLSPFDISQSDLASYNVLRGVANGLCSENIINGYKVVISGHGTGGPFVAKTMSLMNFTYSDNIPIADIGMALIEGGNHEESWPLHSGSVVVASDRNDLYVSLVSGLGSVLGSQDLIPGGFILNNGVEMGSLTANNRVVSLSVPFIAVDSNYVCGRRLISGAADARDAVQLLYRLLSLVSSKHYLNSTDVDLVVESPRVRFTTSIQEHLVWIEQYARMNSPFEPEPSIAEKLALQKHFIILNASLPYPSLNVLQKINDYIEAHADSRGNGIAVVF